MTVRTAERGRLHLRPSRLGVLIIAVSAITSPSVRAADDSPRVVVLTTDQPTYRAASEAAMAELRAHGTTCELVVISTKDADARRESVNRLAVTAPGVILASGATLTDEVLEAIPKVPVVALMTPNALDTAAFGDDAPQRERLAGVTSDVAPRAQVEWLQTTVPDCKRVAVLCSANSERTAGALRIAGEAAGIEITPISTQRDRFPSAIDALNQGRFDGVLMIPDSRVYNSPNVQRLLLWGLRQKRAVWAFSDNVVKAGALAGISSEPVRVGKQGADLAHAILEGKSPKSIGLVYPHNPLRAVNLRTAEMIGVRLTVEKMPADTTKYGERD